LSVFWAAVLAAALAILAMVLMDGRGGKRIRGDYATVVAAS
jgi:hypothetical protein